VLTNLRFRKLQETIMDKWKMSIGHLQEIWVDELNGDVISDLKRHQAAKIIFSRNTDER
jgi:hypothetical protein